MKYNFKKFGTIGDGVPLSSSGCSPTQPAGFYIILLCAALLLVPSGCSYVSGSSGPGPLYNSIEPAVHPVGFGEPYFDSSTQRNVTALVGKTTYLSCRVRNLRNRTVSWIRHRDIHILTVGPYTYTSDQRFQAIHHDHSDEWTLQIKYTQKRDAGIYECQISTQPHRSYFVNLNVVDDHPEWPPVRMNDGFHTQSDDVDRSVPTATILGGPDLHVDKGSMINLTCIIKYSPEPPAYIFWYHQDECLNMCSRDGEVISYDSQRGGVSVITEKGETTTSYLLIQNAQPSDSGKYSCSPSNADVASVRVHVLNGERPAAMQTGGVSRWTPTSVGVLLLCISLATELPIYDEIWELWR